MFKNFILKSGLIFLIALNLMPIAHAQTEEDEFLKAIIKADTSVETNRNIIFDASNSFVSTENQETSFEWDFGDGNKDEGIEVVHTYTEPHLYTVTLTITEGENSSTKTHNVHVYRKLALLLADKTESQKRISAIKNYASDQQVFIKEIESFGSASEFISEEILAKKLIENAKLVEKTKQIVVWTEGGTGLNALSRFLKETSQESNDKIIVVISDDIESSARRIQRQFMLLNPRKIIIAMEASIYPFVDSTSDEDFINKLEKGGYQYKVIDSKTGELRPWNFMSYFMNSLIEKGIPDNTILLILLLPVIATVVAAMRQVVGVTTFGIYSPSIITLAFLILGLKFGLITFIIILIMGGVVRQILKRFRLLFIPKMAIVLTSVSLTIFAILTIGINFNFFDAEFISLAIFPMLIMSTLSEKFVNTQSSKDLKSAIVLMGETILVSIIAFAVVGGELTLGIFTLKIEFVKNLMLTYPELIFLILVINILLGKWTGLRVLEYIRFREILRHTEE